MEHLNNPDLFLGGLHRFMGPHSRLIISMNNAFSLPNLFRLRIGTAVFKLFTALWGPLIAVAMLAHPNG
jgi:hypothetical protein